MSDMYGSLLSNTFTVKDVAQFKTWFKSYYFGDDIEFFINEETREVCFGGHEQYPCAFPRIRNEEEDIEDAELDVFAKELCEHLVEGEVFSVIAGGNEKLRYVLFDRLIIAQDHPDKPYVKHYSSEDDHELLLKQVQEQKT